MREIELTRGYVALVDDEDYDRVNALKWCALVVQERSVYARSWYKGKHMPMHKFVMETDHLLDHRDRNGLNNQKHNLRHATWQQNLINSIKPQGPNGSGYRGVGKCVNRWQAVIRVNGTRLFLGSFITREEAALAYNEAARRYHGEFAVLNILE